MVSNEASRPTMELPHAFRTDRDPNEIGSGVYAIHSPRVPDVGEMTAPFALARERHADGRLSINPDCGLKTGRWEEARPALANIVAAAKRLRSAMAEPAA